jgi:ectoine hydroxylase-related dioxygenase (phytanoyl-CoA dioxygenase family)
MSPDEYRSFFEANGYLAVEGLLSPQEVAECQQEVARLHRVAADRVASGGVEKLGEFQLEPGQKDRVRDGLPVLRKIERTDQHSEIFKNLAAHPRLVDVVQRLIGPDLLLFRSTLMLKPARHGSAHALHQDSAYWPMEPPTLVTVSIMLNDATEENGCLRIVPGSHRWGLHEWGQIAVQKEEEMVPDASKLDLSRQISFPIPAGSALFFHSLTVHGSGPNRSPNSRNTALYAYFPATVRYVPRGPSWPQEKEFRVIAGLGGKETHTLVAAKQEGRPLSVPG